MKAIATSILFAAFTYAFIQSADWVLSSVGKIFNLVALGMSIVFFIVTLKHLSKNE